MGLRNDNAVFLAQRERLIEGMRMAEGLEGWWSDFQHNRLTHARPWLVARITDKICYQE